MGINKAELQPKNFVELFMAREDRVMLNARGKIVSQQIRQKKHEFIMRAGSHLDGETRMGFFNMLEDGTVPWALVVFEEGGPVKETAKNSVLLMRELQKLGFRSARVHKGMFKGENYNVWIFFDQPLSAKKVRHFLFTLLGKLGFPRDLPVIPTTDILSPGDFGHHVWLPYFNGVDKWRMPDGSIKDGMGIKQDCDMFIDEENNPLKTNIFRVAKNTERDLDQAIIALSTDLANCYTPGAGAKTDKTVMQSFLFSCEGFRNIVNEIESKGTTNEDGLVRLAVLLNSLGQEALLKYYMDKVTDLVPVRFKSKYDLYTGPIFPECIDLKQIGCCPQPKVCFPKTARLKDHLGFWKEDESLEKNQEPTSAGWFYKAIAAKSGAGGTEEETDEVQGGASPDSGTPATGGGAVPAAYIRPLPEVEVEPLAEFLDEFFQELEETRKNYIAAPRAITGLNSGFDALNEILDGLTPGTLMLLGGNPGAGKSTFARQMFDLVIEKEKVPAIYISFSLSREELQRKTLSRLSGIPYRNLKRGDLSDADWAKVDRINKMVKTTMGEKGFVLEGDETLTAERIAQAVQKSGAKFAVVDSLQGMSPTAGSNPPDRETLHTVNLIGLKRVCRTHDIPLLVVSNGIISDEMEYHADVFLQLNPLTSPAVASSDKKPYINLLNVEKNREGISKITIQYTFFPPRMTYYGEKVIEYRPVG